MVKMAEYLGHKQSQQIPQVMHSSTLSRDPWPNIKLESGRKSQPSDASSPLPAMTLLQRHL